MKFYVKSVLFGGYNYVESILKAYPKITNYSVEEVEGVYRPCKMLAVELNTAEDFLRFVKEVDCQIIVTDSRVNGTPCILIFDDWIDFE